VTETKPTPKLDPNLVERIKIRAQQEEINVAELIERAIYFYLDHPSAYIKNDEIDGRITEAIAPLRREVAVLRAELSEYGQVRSVEQPANIYSPQRIARELYND
jgi:Ribbon-helix-helix protein, copG family